MPGAFKLEVIKEGPWKDAPSNATPPLLLLHGFPDSPSLFDEVATHFLSKGRRIARVAWPNCGAAPDLPWGASFSELLEALIDVVEEIGPVDVIAHDWGSVMLWMLERERQDLVKSIVSVDVGGELARDLKTLAFIVAYQTPLVLAYLASSKYKVFADGIVRVICAILNKPPSGEKLVASKGYWYYYFFKHAFKNDPYVKPFLGSGGRLSKCPALYVYGAHKPAQFHSEEWLNKMKRRPDCSVIRMETGHWVFVEKLEEFLQHVDKFYSTLPSAK